MPDNERISLADALRSCGVGAGDEVCVPSFAPGYVAGAVMDVGGVPVFVGAEELTWNMDAQLLEDAVVGRLGAAGRKPKAIVLTAAYGMPAEIHRICEISFRHHIPLIEDVAGAAGSRFCGRDLGTFGRHACNMKPEDEGNPADQRRIQALCEDLFKDVDGIKVHVQPAYDLPEGEAPFYDSCYSRCTALVDLDIKSALAPTEIRPLYRPLHTCPEYAGCPVYTNHICEDLYRRGLCLPAGTAVMEEMIKRASRS